MIRASMVSPDVGYSGTPLPRKLGIKPKSKLLLMNAPPDFRSTLGQLPEDVTVTSVARASANSDTILLFADRESTLRKKLLRAQQAMTLNGAIWICWPKQASGVPTDLNENVVRIVGLSAGLVDIKVCAIDRTWSGLRFVIPVKNRAP